MFISLKLKTMSLRQSESGETIGVVFFLNSASHDICDSIYDLCQQDLAVVLFLHRVQDQ